MGACIGAFIGKGGSIISKLRDSAKHFNGQRIRMEVIREGVHKHIAVAAAPPAALDAMEKTMAQVFSGQTKQPPYRLIDAGRSPMVPAAAMMAAPAPAVAQVPPPVK